MGKDEGVCPMNPADTANNYIVNTFSLPESIVAPKGDQAIYTCPGEET